MNDLIRLILWRTWDANGVEHLELSVNSDTNIIYASGTLIGVNEENPFRIYYSIGLTSDYRVKDFWLNEEKSTFELAISNDGNRQWIDEFGKTVLTEFDDCIDIDITATPFTNTLPIRRLGLKPGESADIKVVYVDVFERRVYPAAQRYTCITPHLYRFEMPSIDFTAEIPVDDDGFVLDYPELFQRVWPRPAATLREAPQHNIVS